MNILNPRRLKERDLSKSRMRAWVVSSALLCLVFSGLFLASHLYTFPYPQRYVVILQKILLLGAITFAVLTVARIVERVIGGANPSPAARYNLIRLIRLIAVMVILMVGASLIFENWYTAAVSLGLISLLVGFALQTPITSLIGWLYIVVRTPYHVGERIQIDSFKGDVVEISYLDTTLWEFGGDYLVNDLPSGRLVRFPNSLVLQSAVFNYSWSKFPYLWNEIPFHLAYESDLPFVEEVLKRITKVELDQHTDEKIDALKRFMANTPVSEVDIKEYPFVAFRINANTWVEATVTYLVNPKKAADIRSRIIKKVLAELNKNPERAMFPKSNAR